MKSSLLMLLAAVLFAGSLWFFHLCGGLLAGKDYLAGTLHIFVGLATIRGGVELARLSVVLHLRSRS